MSAWLQMRAAPRDGTRILGWFGDRTIVVFWRSGPGHKADRGKTVWYWSDGYSRYREPDFWQPEPPPPPGARAAERWEPRAPAPVAERKPRRTLAERRQTVRLEIARQIWCSQCERRVSAREAAGCASPHCKAKLGAALEPAGAPS